MQLRQSLSFACNLSSIPHWAPHDSPNACCSHDDSIRKRGNFYTCPSDLLRRDDTIEDLQVEVFESSHLHASLNTKKPHNCCTANMNIIFIFCFLPIGLAFARVPLAGVSRSPSFPLATRQDGDIQPPGEDGRCCGDYECRSCGPGYNCYDCNADSLKIYVFLPVVHNRPMLTISRSGLSAPSVREIPFQSKRNRCKAVVVLVWNASTVCQATTVSAATRLRTTAAYVLLAHIPCEAFANIRRVEGSMCSLSRRPRSASLTDSGKTNLAVVNFYSKSYIFIAAKHGTSCRMLRR